MTDITARLLKRLDEIGQSLSQSGHGLALLGLGSVGIERNRLDDYSDLDFFVIVEPGYKQPFIANLDWLSRIRPVVYAFQNTVDGHKLLFDDGVFCEFAVFEPDELAHIPFAEGQVVWQAEGFDAAILTPKPLSPPKERPMDWLLGEALTNLYVGMARYRRGEKISAQRFIQHYAVDRIIEMAARLEAEQPGFRDLFSGERRFEQRFPNLAAWLPQFIQGYERTPDSAKAILTFLEQHFEINPAMKAEILRFTGD
jgi:hypothetical protein